MVRYEDAAIGRSGQTCGLVKVSVGRVRIGEECLLEQSVLDKLHESGGGLLKLSVGIGRCGAHRTGQSFCRSGWD